MKPLQSFFANLRRKFFMSRREQEVHQIFAHINGRKAHDFPFSNRAQMNKLTDARARNVRAMLDLIDKQAPEMGEAYGDAFRYLMLNDLYARLEMYAQKAQQQIPHASRVAAFAT
jgi:hypothetical protein